MHTALRPFSTAAIALTAASLVAVAPVTAPLPEVQLPAISSASVQLAASTFVDPIARWGEVLTTTQANVQRIFDAATAQPFPVLTQIVANQTRYANTIGTSLSSGAEGLFKFVTGDGASDLPTLLAKAHDALAQGDLKGAAQQISFALSSMGFSLFSMLPMLSIPGEITQNIANVAALLAAQGLNTGLIGKPAFGLLSLAQTAVGVTGTIAQSLVDAATDGDPAAALSAIVNAPANFTDAMLNGELVIRPKPFPPGRTVGILTPSGYTYWTPAEALFVKIPQAIAAAITPPASPPTSPPALAAAKETPTATAASTPDASTQPDGSVLSAPEAESEPTESEATPTGDDHSAAAKVSSTGATDLSAGNKAEPGKIGTTSTRHGQRLRASMQNATDQVNKDLNIIRDSVEKSVSGLKDRISKATPGKSSTEKAGKVSAGKAGKESAKAGSNKSGSDS